MWIFTQLIFALSRSLSVGKDLDESWAELNGPLVALDVYMFMKLYIFQKEFFQRPKKNIEAKWTLSCIICLYAYEGIYIYIFVPGPITKFPTSKAIYYGLCSLNLNRNLYVTKLSVVILRIQCKKNIDR